MTYLFLWLTLGANWELKNVTFVIYEDANTYRKTLAKNLIELLKKYNLKNFIITYVKNEGI